MLNRSTSPAVKQVEKTVLIWYSAQQMFDLVRDVTAYPQFLPWCSKASIVQQYEDGIAAKLQMAMGAIKQNFSTRNTYQEPHSLKMELIEGPFSVLEGVWQFEDIAPQPGSPVEKACRVTLNLDYAFSNAMVATIAGPIFDKIANSLVDAFVARADKVYA